MHVVSDCATFLKDILRVFFLDAKGFPKCEARESL